MKTQLLLSAGLILLFSCFIPQARAATINAASCSLSAVQAAVNSASDGDTVIIPDGSCTWTSGISTTKQIKIRAKNYTPTYRGDATRSVIITNNAPVGTSLFDLTSGNDYHVGIAGIRFNEVGVATGPHITVRGSGSKVPLVNDCYFEVLSKWGNAIDIAQTVILSQGGVFWNCYWKSIEELGEGSGTLSVHLKSPRGWYTAPTMGAADTNGTINVYIEDSTFFDVSGLDTDDQARLVVRHCMIDGVGGGTHGFTSAWGGRHVEYYDNTFDVTTWERNVGGRFYWMRAGTGVFTDNEVNCRYNGYQIIFFDSIVELGGDYPKSRQVGWGHNGIEDVIDPVYIWDQTGTPLEGVYSWRTSSPTYIHQNKEIYVNNGAKPGYSKYTYPHPLTLSGQQNCSSLRGTPCSSGQICLGGSFTYSSDYGNLCCVGGICQTTCTDSDNDTYYAESGCGSLIDCNDSNDSIHPGAKEICSNGIDEECSGQDLQCHRSDTNKDGCTDMNELTAFIDLWKINSSDATLKEIIEAIGLWKRGC